MIRKIIFSIFLFIVFLTACKPYNSSETNKQLLQGTWRLVDIKLLHTDSTTQDLMQDSVYLSFKGDSLKEFIDNQTIKYTFQVKKYSIILKTTDSTMIQTTINSLSKDTLRMRSSFYDRIYIKEK